VPQATVPRVVRLATAADAPALADMLIRAFHEDPVSVWTHPSARARPRRLRRFFAGRLRTLLPEEMTWTTPERDGAAIWAPPDRWAVPVRELLRGMGALSWSRAPVVLYGLGGIERAHPAEPHLYLSVLGVDPPCQGRGLGSRLIAPGLELCDREGVPAYLETARERNVVFYERHGFRVTHELTLPRGPRLWLMWRDPR
jgi:GNAT superfamily N-acetyltransferase